MAIKKCYAILHIDPSLVVEERDGYAVVGRKQQGFLDFFPYKESLAIKMAEELASKHPGTTVILLEAKSLVEAKKPDTISKEWKTNGELIPIERKKEFNLGEAVAVRAINIPADEQADRIQPQVLFNNGVNLDINQILEENAVPPVPRPRNNPFR